MEYDHEKKKKKQNGVNGNNGHVDESDDMSAWFEGVSRSAGEVQTETLRRILELNWGVEYLKKWLGDRDELTNFDDSDVLESLYRKLVPLSSHADLEPYIQRIADGDTSPILTQQPITTLSLSSGTTEGRQKYVPFTKHSAQTTLQIFRLAAAYRSRAYPIREGGRILEFIYSSRQLKTKGGISVGTATTHYYNSEEFKIKQEKTKSFTCSPKEVISIGDYKQSTYCHLLLGLFFSDKVEFITSTFSYSLVQAFTAFEELWRDLCQDLRHGTLSPKVEAHESRETVLRVLSSSPGLAERIEKVCVGLERVGWRGLVPALWPNAKYVYSIMTGSMLPYLRKLRHYAGDNLPLVSADYGSTESWIGANLDPQSPPEDVSFAVVPTFSYFEFIPLRTSNGCDCHDQDFVEDDPVPLSRVEIGQQYEIVLTTFTGLYRYRLGDVVEVVGFHNSTPKLSFVCRRKLILTVNIDKNTEKDLQIVVHCGSELLSSNTGGAAELVDFTSHADVAAGHYVIYWEIEGNASDAVLEECCGAMDAAFVDHGYVVSRRSGSIGPLRLRIVERGSFRKIMERSIADGAALSQFKTPRCTTNLVILGILNGCTVKTFRSSAYSDSN